MAISSLCKPLGIVAAVISLVQGLAWIILSIMAILIHAKSWKPSFSEVAYGQLLSKEIVGMYLNGDVKIPLTNKFEVDLIIGSAEFLILLIIYLALSVLWVTIASIVIWVIFKEKVNLIKNWYIVLGISLCIICVYDLVLGGLLAYDFDTIVEKFSTNPRYSIYYMKISACGVVMTLVFKGFTLWIVNLIFAVVTIKLGLNIPNKVSKDDFEPIIDAFGTSTATTKNEVFGLFHGLPRLPPIQSTNERLTNLNKITYPASGTPVEVANSTYLYSLHPEESDFDTISVDSFGNPPLKSVFRNRY